MTYTVQQLSQGANQTLYTHLIQKISVTLHKAKPDENSWGCSMTGTVGHISYIDTLHPNECFAHELLHFNTQLEGYNRIYCGLSMDSDVYKKLDELIPALDNEFQHYKMYPLFEKMGYKASTFYNDADKNVTNYLYSALLTPDLTLLRLSLPYLTAIGLGGSMSGVVRSTIKNMFHKYEGGKFAKAFKAIDNIFADWSATTSYDAEPYIKRFIEIITTASVWISYEHDNSRFPNRGFFINGEFDVERR